MTREYINWCCARGCVGVIYCLTILYATHIQSTNARDKNIQYSTTPCIQIKWDGEPSGYAENPDNWTFL